MEIFFINAFCISFIWINFNLKTVLTAPVGTSKSQRKLFEGDIVGIDAVAVAENLQDGIYANDNVQQIRWENGTIPYQISEEFDIEQRQIIIEAMRLIHSSTCVTFVPKGGYFDYIHIASGTNCGSKVGAQRNGAQVVSLQSPGCLQTGKVQHELMHALGLYHEQSRSDRDEYVEINWENLEAESVSNFQKWLRPGVAEFGLPYDFESLMHYERNAFAKDETGWTIQPKANYEYYRERMGQREKLSDLDIIKIKLLYECDKGRSGTSLKLPRPVEVTSPGANQRPNEVTSDHTVTAVTMQIPTTTSTIKPRSPTTTTEKATIVEGPDQSANVEAITSVSSSNKQGISEHTCQSLADSCGVTIMQFLPYNIELARGGCDRITSAQGKVKWTCPPTCQSLAAQCDIDINELYRLNDNLTPDIGCVIIPKTKYHCTPQTLIIAPPANEDVSLRTEGPSHKVIIEAPKQTKTEQSVSVDTSNVGEDLHDSPSIAETEKSTERPKLQSKRQRTTTKSTTSTIHVNQQSSSSGRVSSSCCVVPGRCQEEANRSPTPVNWWCANSNGNNNFQANQGQNSWNSGGDGFQMSSPVMGMSGGRFGVMSGGGFGGISGGFNGMSGGFNRISGGGFNGMSGGGFNGMSGGGVVIGLG